VITSMMCAEAGPGKSDDELTAVLNGKQGSKGLTAAMGIAAAWIAAVTAVVLDASRRFIPLILSRADREAQASYTELIPAASGIPTRRFNRGLVLGCERVTLSTPEHTIVPAQAGCPPGHDRQSS
jgi:hypothetical protein